MIRKMLCVALVSLLLPVCGCDKGGGRSPGAAPGETGTRGYDVKYSFQTRAEEIARIKKDIADIGRKIGGCQAELEDRASEQRKADLRDLLYIYEGIVDKREKGLKTLEGSTSEEWFLHLTVTAKYPQDQFFTACVTTPSGEWLTHSEALRSLSSVKGGHVIGDDEDYIMLDPFGIEDLGDNKFAVGCFDGVSLIWGGIGCTADPAIARLKDRQLVLIVKMLGPDKEIYRATVTIPPSGQ